MWYEAHGTMESAIAWEKAIKKWRPGLAWKKALIWETNPEWCDLWEELA